MIARPNPRLLVAVLTIAAICAACGDAPPSSPDVGTTTAPEPSANPLGSSSPLPATAGSSAAAASAAPGGSAPAASFGPYDWSYEGATGPAHWAELSDNYYACKDGVTQSPIEIGGGDEKREPDPVFGYQAGTARIVNDGHTVMAIPNGMNTLTVYHLSTFDPDQPESSSIDDSPVSYLTQLQFHVPPEHVIAGADPAAAEVQFVHQHPNGAFTIVGAMVVEGPEDNAAWASYIDAMTTPVGVEGVPATIDWPNLIRPEPQMVSWRYDGSLTTPPCTERVAWIFLAKPITLSAAQIGKMRAAYDGNARPLQPFGTYRSLTQDLKDD